MEPFFQTSYQTPRYTLSHESLPYLVAEIGLNHNGDLELGKEIIAAAAQSGANAVKFQFYTTHFFIYEEEKIKPLKNIFAQYELSWKQAEILKSYADSFNIDFFATPLTLDWIKPLTDLEVPFIKVASGDLNNYQLLYEIITRSNTPVIISNGAASLKDFEKTVSLFQYKNYKNVIFLYCVSMYPTPMSALRLDTINEMSRITNGALIGFSDHTESQLAPFAAVIKGARIIEKHFTINKSLEGPDHAMSASPEQLAEIRKKIDLANSMVGTKYEPHKDEVANEYFGKRSLYRINNKFIAMRPRKPGMPKDSDFDHLMWERFNQD